MEVKAVTKYVRISPRKARLAADLIRGMQVERALEQLTFCQLKGGRLLKKVVLSALASAENNFDRKRTNMWIADVRVDGGPTLKRSKPKNKGGRHAILKRTSHFTVVLAERGA